MQEHTYPTGYWRVISHKDCGFAGGVHTHQCKQELQRTNTTGAPYVHTLAPPMYTQWHLLCTHSDAPYLLREQGLLRATPATVYMAPPMYSQCTSSHQVALCPPHAPPHGCPAHPGTVRLYHWRVDCPDKQTLLRINCKIKSSERPLVPSHECIYAASWT